MRRPLLLCLLGWLLLPALLSAQGRELRGYVVRLGEHWEKIPQVNIMVTILGAGGSDTTNSLGVFRLKLKEIFKAGETVTLVIDKPEWRIRYPLEGQAHIPADLEKEVVEVQLLPLGSTRFWTHDRVEKFIRDTAESFKSQVAPSGPPAVIDFGRAIKAWAVKYGFSAAQAKTEIDRWMAEVDATQSNPNQLGLAAFARKNVGEAGQLFHQSAEEKEQRLAAIQHDARRLTEEVVRDFRLAGDAHDDNVRFDQALHAHQRALSYVSGQETPQLWAATWVDIGRTHGQLGIRTEGPAIARDLSRAVQAYHQALEVYTREHLPQQWAMTQTNLGNALRDQTGRTAGETRTRLLAEAVTAYRAALEVYTREQLPQQWAMTQTNLGNALRDQAGRTAGETRTRLLAEAVTAYRAALEVYTREQLPQQWAMTQTNLGNALRDQAGRTAGETRTRLLAEAVTAYRAALEVYTREQLPQQWAMTQTNLGNALRDQAGRTAGEVGARLLAEAVTAYRAALEVYTREQLPQQWAHTHRNLAQVYIALDAWADAATSYTSVLAVYPDDDTVYRAAHVLYHDRMLEFAHAFALTEQWLERHPEDHVALSNFAELHFTTGRFPDCEELLSALLATPPVEASTDIALRAIQIANAVALGKTELVPSHLDALVARLVVQPEAFTLRWSFNGTKHVIRHHDRFSPHRPWLLQFFEALEGPDRGAILSGVQGARASVPPPLP